MKPVDILHDERTIVEITWDRDDGSRMKVGEWGITAIVAYGEPGEYCAVPWLAVYRDADAVFRIPAGQVMLAYVDSDIPVKP